MWIHFHRIDVQNSNNSITDPCPIYSLSGVRKWLNYPDSNVPFFLILRFLQESFRRYRTARYKSFKNLWSFYIWPRHVSFSLKNICYICRRNPGVQTVSRSSRREVLWIRIRSDPKLIAGSVKCIRSTTTLKTDTIFQQKCSSKKYKFLFIKLNFSKKLISCLTSVKKFALRI